MVNTITIQKVVENVPKLHKDLSEDSVCGSEFDYVSTSSSEVTIHFKQDVNQTIVDAATTVVTLFVETSVEEQVLAETRTKEAAGRAALQAIVAHLNKDGDYFTSADQGITGSELMWPVEAFMKRGFFVFAFRKFCLTVPATGTTIYDQATQDFMEGEMRKLCKDYSGVDDATLDYIKSAAVGTV